MLLPSYFFLTVTDLPTRGIFTDLCNFTYNVITVCTFGWASYRTRKARPALYRAWFVLTLAVGTLLVTVTLWFMVEVLLQRQAAASTGAIFILFANLLIWWGIHLIPQAKQSAAQIIRRILDSVTVLLGSALIIWWVWINPIFHESTPDLESLLVAILYPVGGLTVVAALISLLFEERPLQPRGPLLLLSVSFLFMSTGHLWFAIQTATKQYQSGLWGDYIWLVAFVFAAMSAALQATTVHAARTTEPPIDLRYRVVYGIRIALPPLTMLVTYLIMVFVHNDKRILDYILMAIGIALMFVFVSVRQLMTLLENFSLTFALRTELAERRRAQKDLQRINEALEYHVAKRTEDLVQLNEQLRQNERQLRFEAFHDRLTGLPNRAAFVNHLEDELNITRISPAYHFAVLFLDYDGFKIVNDSLGHWLGDEFLMALAQRLQTCVPAGNFVARLGGDEFVILLRNLSENHLPLAFAEQIQQAFRQPFEIRGYRLFTSASIGVVINDETHSTADDLLRDADIAMYRAKEAGKARCVMFDSTMRAQAIARLGLETALRNALAHNEMHLVYQPIWELASQQITGFEALVRWRHAEHGVIAPNEFIPIAEETGLIIPLGEWVLEEACRQLKEWQARRPQAAELTVSVNISARQLHQSDLSALVQRTLQKVGLPASSLKLEITESVFMEDIEAAIAASVSLRALGVQLQIDDFGTGYSSFSYLHRLPLNTLKIDKSFIDGINQGEQHSEIVRAIATLAHNLQLSVIAEGVETEEQLTHVELLGCEQVQGYLIAKPLSNLDAERFIQSSFDRNFSAHMANATPVSFTCPALAATVHPSH
ncbi:MAG: EAL domain-containing protein [Caldilineaceae bacterium]